MVLVLSGHVFNPRRGWHGLVRETLSTVGGCASILKAGRLGNLGEEQQARGQGPVASAALSSSDRLALLANGTNLNVGCSFCAATLLGLSGFRARHIECIR